MNKYERTIKFLIKDLKQLRHKGGTFEAIAAQFKISRTIVNSWCKKYKELSNVLEAPGPIFATFHNTTGLDAYCGAYNSNTAGNDHRVCMALLRTRRKTRSMRTYTPPKSCGVNRAKTLYQKSPLATTKSNP